MLSLTRSILLAAFISFILSVSLWFSGYKDEGMFVGIWVPSILSLGALLLAAGYLSLSVWWCEPVAFGCLQFPLPVGSLLAAGILFFPPLALMAMISPILVRTLTPTLATVGTSVGRLSAIGTLGMPVLHDPQLWWCVAALPLTGLLNVGVSFTLALRVAVRSRGVRVTDRARLWRAVLRRLWRQPGSFVLPPRSLG